MQFRIAGEHQHVAVVGAHTFSCIRRAETTPQGLMITWTAYKDSAVLKSDCRTLNEAKNLCRSTLPANGQGASADGGGQVR
jgi:hypothetical protein